jgi:AcrR family transcriptional regulator
MEITQRAPMSGRKAQAARNDELIKEAARAVFTADPGAPISAVADAAGVGISALYRRYKSKEELLQRLADEGMDRYLGQVQEALDDEREAWTAFADFMRRCLDMGAGAGDPRGHRAAARPHQGGGRAASRYRGGRHLGHA